MTDTVFLDAKAIGWRYDTIFHENGQPFTIQIRNEKEGYIKRHLYDAQGVLLETIPPDSLCLVSFKDNVNCYYGLKKRTGDTVFKARLF